jgi:hypothetical protein
VAFFPICHRYPLLALSPIAKLLTWLTRRQLTR